MYYCFTLSFISHVQLLCWNTKTMWWTFGSSTAHLIRTGCPISWTFFTWSLPFVGEKGKTRLNSADYSSILAQKFFKQKLYKWKHKAVLQKHGTTLVMLAKLLLWVCLLSLKQDIHWREGTALVMFAKLLLWVCLLSLNQDIHWREGTTSIMLAKLLPWGHILSLNQDNLK